MKKTVYDLMDWPRIEAIVYSEDDNPHEILGSHMTPSGFLIQAFLPDALKVTVKLLDTDFAYPMELQDEAGFFAVLLPKKTKMNYVYQVDWKDGHKEEIVDPYCFEPQLEQKDIQKFNCGLHYSIFNIMGAKPMTVNGIRGVLFTVWAPNAVRVSVVGNFNRWDGRRHPMRRLWDSGIFELFIPEIAEGSIYKYELKLKGNLISLKNDPYANEVVFCHETASIVSNLDKYEWKDKGWLENRKKINSKKEPILIYEVHLSTFMEATEENPIATYRDLAPRLADYVKEMGYTHIELLPIMEYLEECKKGYCTIGYYAPTSRFGTPEDFQFFVDYMHGENIGVIIEWTPMGFPKNISGLVNFDGTCLYEHKDIRQGYHPKYDLMLYNYARPEVSNFLIANALFWVEKYHADGIKVHRADAVLYLDYDKNMSEWLPNIYGSNENLDGIEFLRSLNSVLKKKHKDVLLIAEEDSGWPGVTEKTESDGLGFDLKFNNGWVEDFLNYMSCDPLFRSGRYADLSMSMLYAYSEDFILPFSNKEVRDGKASMVSKMPGDRDSMLANLRATYGFMMCHPGKKLLFMGQDIAQFSGWSCNKVIEWDLLQFQDHQDMKNYVKEWNYFCRNHPALYVLDYDPDGFEWINHISTQENILIFLRKTRNKQDTLLIVCNFVPVLHEDYKIGVPYAGKYKEIFSSNSKIFGGSGMVNPRVKQSRKDECDGREHSIRIKVAPLTIAVFQYSKVINKTNKKPSKPSIKETLAKQVIEAEQAGNLEKQKVAAKEVAEVNNKIGK